MNTLYSYLDLIYDFYESPFRGADKVRERVPVGLGVLCFILSGIAFVVAQALKGGGSRYLFNLFPWEAVLVGAGLLPLVSGFLLAGIFQLTAEFMGAKQGRASAMFILLGFCQLLYILYLPVVLTSEILSGHPEFWRAGALFVLGIVSMLLKLVSIRSNYGLNTSRALTVLVLPYVVGLLLALALLAAMVGGVVSLGNLMVDS